MQRTCCAKELQQTLVPVGKNFSKPWFQWVTHGYSVYLSVVFTVKQNE